MFKRKIEIMMLVLAGSLLLAVPAFADETGTDTEINVIYAAEEEEPDDQEAEVNETLEDFNKRVVVSAAIKPIDPEAEEEEDTAEEDTALEETAETEEAEEEAAAQTEEMHASLGRQIAGFAMQFLGRPYVWGGSSLTNGTDCSGFTMSVFKNFGISLPHSSASQRSVGSAVDGLENAQPGDLVCYSGHVGLYIGGGQIVHALNAKKGIVTSSAAFDRILAIRRVI